MLYEWRVGVVWSLTRLNTTLATPRPPKQPLPCVMWLVLELLVSNQTNKATRTISSINTDTRATSVHNYRLMANLMDGVHILNQTGIHVCMRSVSALEHDTSAGGGVVAVDQTSLHGGIVGFINIDVVFGPT